MKNRHNYKYAYIIVIMHVEGERKGSDSCAKSRKQNRRKECH